MRPTFAEAKAKAPCILLIDELDSFGDRASFTHKHKDYSSQVVSALLECLDGAAGRQGVVVIGATESSRLSFSGTIAAMTDRDQQALVHMRDR